MTDRVVLLGHHIGYSASPAVHNAAFAAAGLDARYDLADVPPDGLADAVAALRAPGVLGANVTQPHKVAACGLVDELTPDARRLGALNTIVRDGDRLVGHNTDLPALAAELEELGPFAHATLLGRGGASRAVQEALLRRHTPCAVLNRPDVETLQEVLAESDLLVNATPVGTGSDESPVPVELLRPDLAVLDLVYRPSPTRLVREARAVGATARDGAGMLLRQAAVSFELWTGRAAPIDVMRDALRAELGGAADA